MYCGNNACLDLWYKSAAILLRIPKWSDYCQKLIAISTGECCGIAEVNEIDNDGMIKHFEDIVQDYEGILKENTRTE